MGWESGSGAEGRLSDGSYCGMGNTEQGLEISKRSRRGTMDLHMKQCSSDRKRMKQCEHAETGASLCVGRKTRTTDRNMSSEIADEPVRVKGIR